MASFGQAGTKNVSWQQRNAVSNSNKYDKYDNDHTVISAVSMEYSVRIYFTKVILAFNKHYFNYKNTFTMKL